MWLIIGLLVGGVSFTFLCEGLIRSGFTGFEGLQKKTRDMKNKKIWEYALFVMIGMVILTLAIVIGLGELPQGFILGTLYALFSVIFEDSVFDRLRNTLR